MTRVLMVSGEPVRGGIERFLTDVCGAFDGVEADFCCYSAGGEPSAAGEELRQRVRRFVRITGGKLAKRRAFFRLARDGGYDAVHLHAVSGLSCVEAALARLAGAPVVLLHAHNAGYAGRHARLHPLLRQLSGICATHCIACSEQAADWMFPKRLRNRAVLLTDGIAAERFRFDPEAREALRRELSLAGRTVFAGVARLAPEKNLRFLLEVFAAVRAALPEAALVLVGGGPLGGPLEALAERLGIAGAVRFLGERADVPRLLCAFDLLLFPSRSEGFGIAALEAQAAGLPVLASDRVPGAVNIAGAVRFLPLEAGAAVWARTAVGMAVPQTAENRARASAEGSAAILRAGYGAKTAAERLRAIYRREDGGA